MYQYTAWREFQDYNTGLENQVQPRNVPPLKGAEELGRPRQSTRKERAVLRVFQKCAEGPTLVFGCVLFMGSKLIPILCPHHLLGPPRVICIGSRRRKDSRGCFVGVKPGSGVGMT